MSKRLSRRQPKSASLTLRVPQTVAAEIRATSASAGATITDVVLGSLGHAPKRFIATAVTDARPWTEISYRLARAHEAATDGDIGEVERRIRDAQEIVLAQLQRLRAGYDEALDANS